MRKILTALLTVISLATTAQQIADSVYWVYFKDKTANGYSLGQPETFLSQRSVDRRAWQGLGLDATDLPVTRAYVDSLTGMGARVKHVSRWLNGAVIVDASSELFSLIIQKPFTDTIPWEPVTDDVFFPPAPTGNRFDPPLPSPPDLNYGISDFQIEMTDTHELHRMGYTGRGVRVAVLDVGFRNVDSLPAFTSMISEGRLLGTRNFVNDMDVYRVGSTHGTRVLSLAGAEWSGGMMGTAPHASYFLCLTENGGQETRLEEIAWIEAAEYMDSLGFDIINTSLGYSDFDSTIFDYRYRDMDGRSTFISKASSMTAGKGIICCNSAGNEGNKDWYYITAPADAFDVLTVGAVKPDREIAYFSSRGPSFDARIKPDVVAMGQTSMSQAQNGEVTAGNGTSYSCPLVTGSVASLWQAYPDLPARELIHIVRQSGNRVLNPDVTYGYGIPSFIKAFWKVTSVPAGAEPGRLELYPNPCSDHVMVRVPENTEELCTLHFYDLNGRRIASAFARLPGEISLPELLETGLYIVEVRTQKAVYHQRLMVK